MTLLRKAGACMTSFFSKESSFDDDMEVSVFSSEGSWNDLPVVTRTYTSPADMNASNLEAYQKYINRRAMFGGTSADWRQLAQGRAVSTARYIHSYERWKRAASK